MEYHQIYDGFPVFLLAVSSMVWYKYLDVRLDELRCTTQLDMDVPHTTTARQMDCMGILMYS